MGTARTSVLRLLPTSPSTSRRRTPSWARRWPRLSCKGTLKIPPLRTHDSCRLPQGQHMHTCDCVALPLHGAMRAALSHVTVDRRLVAELAQLALSFEFGARAEHGSTAGDAGLRLLREIWKVAAQ